MAVTCTSKCTVTRFNAIQARVIFPGQMPTFRTSTAMLFSLSVDWGGIRKEAWLFPGLCRQCSIYRLRPIDPAFRPWESITQCSVLPCRYVALHPFESLRLLALSHLCLCLCSRSRPVFQRGKIFLHPVAVVFAGKLCKTIQNPVLHLPIHFHHPAPSILWMDVACHALPLGLCPL